MSIIYPNKEIFLEGSKKLFRYANDDPLDILVKYFIWNDFTAIREVVQGDFQDHAVENYEKILEQMRQTAESLGKQATLVEQALALDYHHFLGDHCLTYFDKMSMAVGVETRVPFLDHRLLEFTQSIPIHLKCNWRGGKLILKKLMEKYLPKEIIYRKKTGLAAPVKQWMKHDYSHFLDQVFASNAFHSRQIFKPEVLKKVNHLNRQGKIGRSYLLYSILCIEIWFQIFIDHKGDYTAIDPIVEDRAHFR